MDKPTASLTINFQTATVDGNGDAVSAFLTVEVNSDDNGNNSQFFFGDVVKYRVFKSPNVTSLKVFTTAGLEGMWDTTTHYETITDTVLFNNSNTVQTSKYINTVNSSTRLGGIDLGSISKAGPTTLKCSKQSSGPTDPLIAVYRVTYRTEYTLRKLYGVSKPTGFGLNGFDSYPVIVYLIGTVTS